MTIAQIQQMNFNSQPHKEADFYDKPVFRGFRYFNSQPHKEADPMIVTTNLTGEHFNSQPHKEADRHLSR